MKTKIKKGAECKKKNRINDSNYNKKICSWSWQIQEEYWPDEFAVKEMDIHREGKYQNPFIFKSKDNIYREKSCYDHVSTKGASE